MDLWAGGQFTSVPDWLLDHKCTRAHLHKDVFFFLLEESHTVVPAPVVKMWADILYYAILR